MKNNFNFGVAFEEEPSTGKFVNTLNAEDNAVSNLTYKKADVSEGTVRDIDVPSTSIGNILRKFVNKVRTGSDAGLENDSDFSFFGEKNTDYLLEMTIFCVRTADGNANISYNFNLPAGGTYDAVRIAALATGITTKVSEAANDNVGLGTLNLDVMISLRGVIKIGSSSGNITFQWGITGGDGTSSITVYAGSWMLVRPLN